MEAGLWETIAGSVNNAADFADLFFSIFCRLSKDAVTYIIMIMWCLWRRCNEKVWHDEVKEPHISIQLARDTLREWLSVRVNKATPAVQQIVTDTNWKPPAKGYVKCNVDAAIFYDQWRFGIGMCI
ncbi:uncharacterized protein [Medicago truncatula]|uniref:uncharacterized protein n=1 Tax=Medicago truncatula TaxID=3880 RepID=UPI0000D5D213|nr:uncharacterized protein LOC112422195 [Medicago truncatula]